MPGPPGGPGRGLPEGLVVQALISQVVVLQVQLPQVAQFTEGTWWDLLQLIVLGGGGGQWRGEPERQPRGKGRAKGRVERGVREP